MIDGWGISCVIALAWISPYLSDNKSTLVQVMAWCRQATIHYLSQCCPDLCYSMTSIGHNELKQHIPTAPFYCNLQATKFYKSNGHQRLPCPMSSRRTFLLTMFQNLSTQHTNKRRYIDKTGDVSYSYALLKSCQRRNSTCKTWRLKLVFPNSLQMVIKWPSGTLHIPVVHPHRKK